MAIMKGQGYEKNGSAIVGGDYDINDISVSKEEGGARGRLLETLICGVAH
jgi:hypothetical protein